MEKLHVTLTGTTPLLMHADSIDWADYMDEWKNNPDNKKLSKAGDDRTPPWRWIGCLYYDDPDTGIITIPSENIMTMIREGASQVLTGKGQKTFKAQSQSGLLCADFNWPLIVNGKTVSMKTISQFRHLKTIQEQKEAAIKAGFSLHIKRARIGPAKHIRVRPRFDNWSTQGEIIVTDEQLTAKVLQSILDISGRLKGLCDWRPSSKTPGPWGMFTATVTKV
jgi:hypothetical protein